MLQGACFALQPIRALLPSIPCQSALFALLGPFKHLQVRALHTQVAAAASQRKQKAEDRDANFNAYFLRSGWPYLAAIGLGTSLFLGWGVFRQPAITDYAYLDIAINNKPAGRVLVGLYGKDTPRTVQNFLGLVRHDKGFGYQGCPIHRVMRGYTVWGGDVTNGDGTGGASIYGPQFGVESMHIHHSRGTVSMVLDEDGRVRSQFFVTLVAAPGLDRKAVAIGRVVEGLEVVEQLSRLPADPQQRPLQSVVISGCGVLGPEALAVQGSAAK